MQILPRLQIKDIHDCSPGELVRLSWGDEPLAFVARHENSFFEILLEGDQVGRTPCYYKCNSEASTVLSYGLEYDFELSQSGPREIRTNRFYETNGAVVIAGQQTLMRVAPARGQYGYTSAYLDLNSGLLANTPQPGHSTFAHWEILLRHENTERRTSLLKFAPKLE